MSNLFLLRAAALSMLIVAPTAQAQTAADYNRASQAMQICASPMGATIAECAQLRGAVGGSPANALSGVLGGGSGGKAAAAAGLLGFAAQAVAARQAKAAAAPPAAPVQFGSNVTTAAVVSDGQTPAQAYKACVARVGVGNQAGMAGCVAQLNAASGVAPVSNAPATTAAASPTASAVGSAAMNVFSSMVRR